MSKQSKQESQRGFELRFIDSLQQVGGRYAPAAWSGATEERLTVKAFTCDDTRQAFEMLCPIFDANLPAWKDAMSADGATIRPVIAGIIPESEFAKYIPDRVRATIDWQDTITQLVFNAHQRNKQVDRPRDPIDAARCGNPYPCTDLGNAERFAIQHGDSVKFDTSKQCWRLWDGRRWASDSSLAVLKMASQTARNIMKEAGAAPAPVSKTDHDHRAALFGWAMKSESRDRLAAMVEVAKSQDGIAVDASLFDADIMAFNCWNGTIDLRSGNLHPHNKSDLLTKLSKVEYHKGTTCPRWERFLMDATGNDLEVIRFLQTVAGYSITGSTVEEKLFLIYGVEASGKTTFLEAKRAILGDYGMTIDPAMLTKAGTGRQSGTASPELARLAGVRLAAGSELEQGRELSEGLAKSLTGGETITARHLYAECFDFMPQFKIMLALNHCPKCNADDGAIWRRMVRVGFDKSVPVEKRDKTLKPYLRDPKGGAVAVLAWAVEGCLAWQREGLTIPKAVERSTQNYRNESDPIHTYFEDCLQFNPMAWTTWISLWTAYNEYAESQGIAERYRVAPVRITERLKSKGCEPSRKATGRGWHGVELKATMTHIPPIPPILESFPTKGNARELLNNAGMSGMSGMATEKPAVYIPEFTVEEMAELT
jgi:putative DNA primase/helicase